MSNISRETYLDDSFSRNSIKVYELDNYPNDKLFEKNIGSVNTDEETSLPSLLTSVNNILKKINNERKNCLLNSFFFFFYYNYC